MKREVKSCDFCGAESWWGPGVTVTVDYGYAKPLECCSLECVVEWATREIDKKLQAHAGRMVAKDVGMWDAYCRECDGPVALVTVDFVTREWRIEPCGHTYGMGFREREQVDA